MSSTGALPPAPTTPVHELNETFGVLLIGFIFAVTLYGLTFFQTYIYYSRYPADNVISRYTISLLWAVDTATTTLLSHTLYYYLITSFMAPFNELDITKTFVAENALAAFAIFVVHIFYAQRIYVVNKKNPVIPGLIGLFALVSLGTFVPSLGISSRAFFYNFVDHSIKIITGVQYGLSALCDVMIVLSLFCYLQPERYPAMKQSSNRFDQAVVMLFNRGTFFTLLQIAALILFVSIPRQQVWVLFHFVTSKTYINSLLLMLNSRSSHRGRGINEEDSQNQHKNTSGGLSGSGGRSREISRGQLGVVDTESKPPGAMTIELDTIHSRSNAEYDDDSDKHKGTVSDIDLQKTDPGF
ncbi:hypothetical protein AcV5_007852 [Taiwanofungus camphoratus]|nr:hypothetical protein AcW2_007514 [Antrodia cinnamomea]KAI0927283.1 hypothetical protein AcV5_007852 [Antrodia cinnamomea]